MRPFLKWAGGKYAIVERIKTVLPQGKRLIEPFVGAGAVFLNTDYPEHLLADNNEDLIDLFNTLKQEGSEFIEYVREFIVPENNNADQYYEFRELFNTTDDVQNVKNVVRSFQILLG